MPHDQEPGLDSLPLVLRVDEVARVLRIGRDSCYALVRSGRIKSVRVGRRILVPREALRRFLEEANPEDVA